MIIHHITLHNFGIYGGNHKFDLLPRSDGRFQKPVIVVRGQNGVGKSTLMEGIRVGLHGKMSLGNRTMQRTYEEYLTQRLHRSPEGETADFAMLELEFDHVFLGLRHLYRIQRTWATHGQRLTTAVKLWIDGEVGPENEEEVEYLLRELIDPGVVELFFFDGEKISTLAEAGDASDALLADTVKNLLGLHLVEQLGKDLDIYLMRQSGVQEWNQYQAELGRLNGEITAATEKQEEVLDMLADCRHRLYHKHEQIEVLKGKIAQQGGQYANQQKKLDQKRIRIKEELAQTEQEIEDLGRGLLPFVAAPRLLTSVYQRLIQEAQFEQWHAAQPLVETLQPLVEELDDNEQGQKIKQTLASFSIPPMAETAVVHRISAEKRGVLLNWIENALNNAPHQLSHILEKRVALQEELFQIEQSLQRVPITQVLQPLQDELAQQNRELGRLESEKDRLTAEDKHWAYQIKLLEVARRRVGEQMASVNIEEERLKLASRTKVLLDHYQQALIQRKLVQLSTQLTKRFAQLSRKANFVERIEVDPQTFALTLTRAGKYFPRTQLSAGEEQILAVATLWALRETSRRPLPILIDTPLSRLDEEHRRAMLEEFLPQAAQQVIVLATTAEVDDETLRYLRPVLSHAYLLQADSTATWVTDQSYTDSAPQIRINEIEVSHAV